MFKYLIGFPLDNNLDILGLNKSWHILNKNLGHESLFYIGIYLFSC
jgi:hypothetical protein